MDLFIQTFYNNYLFEEVFALLKSLNVSTFDCMLYIKNHQELYSKNVNALITHIYDKENLTLNMEDEITDGSMYIYNGEIVDERTKEAMS